MPDSDFSMVKPVDSLPNVASVTPAKEREQRKKRHKAFDSGKTQYEEQDNVDPDFEDGKPGNEEEQHSIDYRA